MSKADLNIWATMLTEGQGEEVNERIVNKYPNVRTRIDVYTKLKNAYFKMSHGPNEEFIKGLHELDRYALKKKKQTRDFISDLIRKSSDPTQFMHIERTWQQARKKSIPLLDVIGSNTVMKKFSRLPDPFPATKSLKMSTNDILQVKKLNAASLNTKNDNSFELEGKTQLVYDMMVKMLSKQETAIFGLLALSGRRLVEIAAVGQYQPTQKGNFWAKSLSSVKSIDKSAYDFPILIGFDKFQKHLMSMRRWLWAKYKITPSMTTKAITQKISSPLNRSLRTLWESDDVLKSIMPSEEMHLHRLRELYTSLVLKSHDSGGSTIRFLKSALHHKNTGALSHYVGSVNNDPRLKLIEY
jgi:hypothetical protein